MYKAFNITLNTKKPNQHLPSTTPNTRDQKEVTAWLKKGSKELLDGNSIQDDWFPAIEADVFISHSHADQKLAIRLAKWLKSHFGLNAFIDSCVWGYANNLLKELDDEYSLIDDSLYSYKRCQLTSSHVHMMLAVALGQMMDRTECLFFLNTPASIATNSSWGETTTHSPWIYYELSTLQNLRQHLDRQRYFSENSLAGINESFQVDYTVDLSSLKTLDSEDLSYWKGISHGQYDPKKNLDKLYEHFGR